MPKLNTCNVYVRWNVYQFFLGPNQQQPKKLHISFTKTPEEIYIHTYILFLSLHRWNMMVCSFGLTPTCVLSFKDVVAKFQQIHLGDISSTRNWTHQNLKMPENNLRSVATTSLTEKTYGTQSERIAHLTYLLSFLQS